MLKKYKYQGVLSGKSFNFGTSDKPEIKEIMFYHGKEVELPEDDKYTQSLVRQGFLIPIDALAAGKAKTAKNSEDK